MKNKIIYIIIAVLSSGIYSSCVNEDLNIDKAGITENDLTQDNNHIGAYFPAIQQMIYCNYNWGWGTDWTFQVMQNLSADVFSGYMASATDFAGNVNNQTYTYMPGWCDSSWDYTYSYLMPNTLDISKQCELDYEAYGHFDAINKILRVMAMSRISDLYGPIIYSQYGKSMTGGQYDGVEELYGHFFADLDGALATLKDYVGKNPAAQPFRRFDHVYDGDYKSWMKFANTLRLRLAMRIVKADANLAKTQAEKAMSDPAGLLEANGDNFTVSGGNYFHPLTAISRWGDISVSANLESILGGYGDARLKAYAAPVIDGEFIGEIKGMRMGIRKLVVENGDNKILYVEKTDPLKYKVSPTIYIKDNSMPAILMTAAESNFLRAEAALRGWNTGGAGSAKDYYEAGIALSFEQWGVPMGDYLTSGKVPSDFIDQLQPDVESSPAVCTTTTAWEDAATDEERLEKIITQKWIASYPEGYNAWAELRRTGYPKLFPITNNTSGGVVPTETGFRRVRFSQAEVTSNAAGVSDATKKLGGPDAVTTRIWWDRDGVPNI